MSSIGKTLFLTFQSTFPIQGTTEGYINSGPVQEISIHVPYTGNDVNGFTQKQLADISIHVPYTGNDDIRRHYILILLLFQSTFPIQGTTRNEEDVCQTNLISIHVPYTGNDESGCYLIRQGDGISIHVPYTGNDLAGRVLEWCKEISIHVPYTGNDFLMMASWILQNIFQSTFPIQGTTANISKYQY